MESPKEVIQELEKAAPGQRFQRLYRKRQSSRHGGMKNGAFAAGGLALIAVGVVSYAIPIMPSDVVILVGIAVLAQGSGAGARALDHAEMHLRRHFGWLIEEWKRLPRPAKWTIYGAWLALVGGLSYWIHQSLG